MAKIGYARVSTDDQDTALQLDALNAAQCDRLYVDEDVSGKLTSRPELDKCLAALRPGDTLVIWKLDRLGRSLQHLINIVEDLKARGVSFKSLTQPIDTTTAGGMLVYQIFGAFAEYERTLIVERTQAGLRAAKKRGAVLGRKRELTVDQEDSALALARSMPVAKVARTFEVSRPTLYRALARAQARLAPIPDSPTQPQ
jgi:DNA invertase Pin-like site-specific DNA recombinase